MACRFGHALTDVASGMEAEAGEDGIGVVVGRIAADPQCLGHLRIRPPFGAPALVLSLSRYRE